MRRRRFLTITGIAGAGALGGLGLAMQGRRSRPDSYPWVWRGVLFGADVTLQLYGLDDEQHAENLTGKCFTEMKRLEQLFSLFEPESSICRLNSQSYLDHPHADFVELVRRAIQFGEITEGAFDITVQPLWSSLNRSEPTTQRQAALAAIDYRSVVCNANRISFERPGTQITLNGIAQGFITDRVRALLESEGVANAIVNMGEYSALGAHPEQRPWEIGIRLPGTHDRILDSVSLEDGLALAVSGGYGYEFQSPGTHHLLNPKTGTCQPATRTVAVIARDAITADALSTACAVVDNDTARQLAANTGARLNIYSPT